MASLKSTVAIMRALQEEQKAKERAEESANKTPVASGEVRVRLVRGLYLGNGRYVPPGVVDLREEEVPASAKRL